MKKRILFLLALTLAALLLLGGCGNGGQKTVTFVYNNGEPSLTVVVEDALAEPRRPERVGYAFVGWTAGDSAASPLFDFRQVPTEEHTTLTAVWREMPAVSLTCHPENGAPTESVLYQYGETPRRPTQPINGAADFLGWYSDSACTAPFDFSAPLTADADIYAAWQLDAVALGNKVAMDILPTTVKIHTTRQSSSSLAVSLGSGVIYARSGGYYYVLTNAHVVAPQSGYTATTYEITDAYGGSYTAYKIASSADIDLAVLRFAAGDRELPTAAFAAADPEVGSLLIAVGSPGSLTNCATYGSVTKYAEVDISGVNTGYTVGWHNAPIDNGSSGGAVFNAEGKIVGISFAAATDSAGSFAAAAFIQRSLVVQFLTTYNLVP